MAERNRRALTGRSASEADIDRVELPPPGDAEDNWWDYCPICNAKLLNQKCKYVCSNPRCNFFMSCSEFDL